VKTHPEKHRRSVVLTIGGSDSGGGAGIQADIKTFCALGWHGTSVLTAITAQNTLGVQKVFSLGREAAKAQLDSVSDDFEVAFAKTGMLDSREIVQVVAAHLQERSTPFVLDPVIEAEAGGRLLKPQAVEALKQYLIPLARVVTPNIFEARALADVEVKDLQSAEEAAYRIADLGADAVIVKGGHLDCTDILLERGEIQRIKGHREQGGNHGVGCTYSAALTSFLARGYPMLEAAKEAQSFAASSIKNSWQVGRGVPPVNQAGAIIEDADRFRVLCEVKRAVEILRKEPALANLILKAGSDVVMAIDRASGPLDIAALDGRLFRDGKRVHPSGSIGFGSCSELGEIVLAAVSFDPRARAALSLNQKAVETCSILGMEIADLSREGESPAQDLLQATAAAGHVPEVILRPGGPGREPMLAILGVSATAVATKAVRIAQIALSGG